MVLYYKTFEILNVSEPTNKFLQLYDCTLNFYFFHYLSKIKDISDKKLTVKSKKRRHTSIMNSLNEITFTVAVFLHFSIHCEPYHAHFDQHEPSCFW